MSEPAEVPSRRSEIFERQMGAEQVLLLQAYAAMAQRGRRILLLQYGLLTTALVLAIASTFHETNSVSPIAVAAALLGLATSIADVTAFAAIQDSLRKEMAAVEEEFDCGVLGLEWNKFTDLKHPSMEVVTQYSSSLAPKAAKRVKPRYPPEIDRLPAPLARLLAQRIACWTDVNRHQRNRRRLTFGLGLATAVALVSTVLSEPSLVNFILVGLAPVVPAYQLLLDQIRATDDSMALSRKLAEALDEIWRTAISGTASTTQISSEVTLMQSKLSSLRASAPIRMSEESVPREGARDDSGTSFSQMVESRVSQGEDALRLHRHLLATTSLAICGSRSGGAVTPLVDGVVAPLSQFLYQHPCQVYHGPVGIGIEVVTHLADHYRPPLLEEVVGLFGHHNVVRRAEYVFVIGGGSGTNDEVDLAFFLGKKVIPFAASGGAAQHAAEMLSLNQDYRQWITPEDLDTLLAAASPEEFVGHVRRLLVA